MVNYRSRKKNTKAGSRPATKTRSSKKPRAKPTNQGPSPGLMDRLCAKHYAEVQLNPFDTLEGACVPILPCLDSAKRKVFTRGIGYIQPNGFGAVNCTTSLVHDQNCVQYTTGTGTGLSLGSTTTGFEFNNSELSTSDFSTSSVQGRIVGIGLRVRYTGKQIDMNGTVYSLEQPSHLSTDSLTVAQMLKLDKVKSVPFSRDWCVATWQPVLPSETSFSESPYATPFAAAMTPLIVMIKCQGANDGDAALPFEWEWYMHYEAIGAGARGKSTSHVAPMAGPMVMAALSKAPTTLFDDVSNRKVSINKVSNHMIEAGSSWQFGDLAKRVVHTAVGALTSRAASQYMSGGFAALAA